MDVFFVFCFGLIIGSFLAALTYRVPKNISIANGRSFCPSCKKQIEWYDNIPLFSYIILKGRCRKCHKKISPRYFFIEFSVGALYALSFVYFDVVAGNIAWLNLIPKITGLAGLFIIIFLLVGIFIIDFEHQFIPDEFVYAGSLIVLTLLIMSDTIQLYTYLLSGFGASMFLLSIHLLTRGKGMGLGDVKLAIFIGLILGLPYMPVWIFAAFVLGSIVGIGLLVSGKTKLKQRIAFGPFLVSAFFVMMFFADNIFSSLF